MQKPMSLALSCFLFVLAACRQPVAPSATPKAPATPFVRPAASTVTLPRAPKVPWTQAMITGGFMFKDEESFRSYLGRSETAVIGTLTSLEGRNVKLHVERVLRGQAGAELALPTSGGFLLSKPGQRVIALLSTRHGEMRLHDFCAASGLYPYTQSLAQYVEGALQPRPH